jgi:hypothetical protein
MWPLQCIAVRSSLIPQQGKKKQNQFLEGKWKRLGRNMGKEITPPI